MEIMKDEKHYKVLERILLDVNKTCVRMDRDSRKEYVDLALNVVSDIITQLKEKDDKFKKMFSKTEYVGSYFDGLRVKSATEFDLNLIMKLPLNYDLIEVMNTNVASGYVKVNIEKAKNHVHYSGEIKKVIDKWCDNNGYLQQNKFRGWMEGLFSRTFGQNQFYLTIEDKEVKIQLRKSGPAFTLMIFHMSEQIDVDLVFTLEFKNKQPPCPIRWSRDLNFPWVIVPKELNGHKDRHLFWRISFSTAEKALLQRQHKLKFTGRLLKALRDAQVLGIPSYFIKTLFLWEAHECTINQSKVNFWQRNLGFLFVYALKKLHQSLKTKKLSYYWHKKMNLFTFNDDHIANMAGRIGNILKKIEQILEENDFSKLKNYIFSLYKINDDNSCIPQIQCDFLVQDSERSQHNYLYNNNALPNNNSESQECIVM